MYIGGFDCLKKQAKQKTLPAHYQLVVLVWLNPAFLSDFYFILVNRLIPCKLLVPI